MWEKIPYNPIHNYACILIIYVFMYARHCFLDNGNSRVYCINESIIATYFNKNGLFYAVCFLLSSRI